MWKDIPGWEKYYEINENGEVRNKIRNNLIIGDSNSSGYKRVCLYNKNNNPQKQRFFRHRLVAKLFISNPNNLPEVNHKNHCLNDNFAENLEWVTRIENERDSRINGNKEYKPFNVEFKNGTTKIYNTKNELAVELGISKSNVQHWLHHRSTSYYKYGIKNIKWVNE